MFKFFKKEVDEKIESEYLRNMGLSFEKKWGLH